MHCLKPDSAPFSSLTVTPICFTSTEELQDHIHPSGLYELSKPASKTIQQKEITLLPGFLYNQGASLADAQKSRCL